MEEFPIVNIRMLLLLVPKNVINAMNINKKRKRYDDSDYMYLKTLPTVVKTYPFFILNISHI
jgi:hypothetical protein